MDTIIFPYERLSWCVLWGCVLGVDVLPLARVVGKGGRKVNYWTKKEKERERERERERRMDNQLPRQTDRQ